MMNTNSFSNKCARLLKILKGQSINQTSFANATIQIGFHTTSNAHERHIKTLKTPHRKHFTAFTTTIIDTLSGLCTVDQIKR